MSSVDDNKEMTDLSEKKQTPQEDTENKTNVEVSSSPEQVQAEPQEQSATTAQSEKSDEVQNLEKEIEQLKAELEKEKDLDMRIRAEYDNYRKRTSKEMGEIAARAKADAIKDILPVADNIDRAIAVQEGCEADIRKGVEMIHTQIINVFEKLGIEEIAEENIPFNPEFHNAVMHMEDENLEANTVVQVLQKGYKIGSKVLRYAMVKVAN